jgi:hypothetical protein
MNSCSRRGPARLIDRRAPWRKRPGLTHADLVSESTCPGRLDGLGTLDIPVQGLGPVPMAYRLECSECGHEIDVATIGGAVLFDGLTQEGQGLRRDRTRATTPLDAGGV